MTMAEGRIEWDRPARGRVGMFALIAAESRDLHHLRGGIPLLRWQESDGTTAVIGWHLPVAFELGMRSHGIHALEDVSFLVTGLLFWCPIVQSASPARSPRWPVALYLFLATLPCDILSAFLVFCNRLVYPFYLSTPRLFSIPP